MLQKLFQNFLPKEAKAFGNNIKKEPQKSRPKLRKYVYHVFKENICSVCNPVQGVVFLQKCSNFVEQRLKFSYLKGSIISFYRKIFYVKYADHLTKFFSYSVIFCTFLLQQINYLVSPLVDYQMRRIFEMYYINVSTIVYSFEIYLCMLLKTWFLLLYLLSNVELDFIFFSWLRTPNNRQRI